MKDPRRNGDLFEEEIKIPNARAGALKRSSPALRDPETLEIF